MCVAQQLYHFLYQGTKPFFCIRQIIPCTGTRVSPNPLHLFLPWLIHFLSLLPFQYHSSHQAFPCQSYEYKTQPVRCLKPILKKKNHCGSITSHRKVCCLWTDKSWTDPLQKQIKIIMPTSNTKQNVKKNEAGWLQSSSYLSDYVISVTGSFRCWPRARWEAWVAVKLCFYSVSFIPFIHFSFGCPCALYPDFSEL